MTISPPMATQRGFWNDWNARHREQTVDLVTIRQADVVESWLRGLGRQDLNLIEVGCGAGWLCPKLTPFGEVTATDLSDEVLARAKIQTPDVDFVAGNFMALDFGEAVFDVAISLEVLAHVADQRLFLQKIAHHLKPGGHLMLATQNRFVLKYLNCVSPPSSGQLRRWVSGRELRALLDADFEVLELFTVTPRIGRGLRGMIQPSRRDQRLPASRAEPPWRPRNGRDSRLPPWLLRQMEALGLGWTLMALARKRG